MKLPKSNTDLRRELGLIEEIRIGFRFVRQGLHEIDRILPGNDFYHPPVQFLALGIERILKCMICMHHKELTGSYPTRSDKPWPLGAKGHDLMVLKGTVVKFCTTLPGPAIGDYNLIAHDKRVDDLFELLSAYGKGSRYFNLDEVLIAGTNTDPMHEYDRLTGNLALTIHGRKILDQITNPKTREEAYRTINKELKALVESIIRALSRQFIFGNFSSQSRRFIADLSPFYKLEDKNLGVNHY